MSITITQLLTASNVPAPQGRNAWLSIAAAAIATNGNALVAKRIIVGSSTNRTAHNENATALDLTGAFGGGVYAVAFGLALSAGAGLTLNVATGQAFIDGLVEVSTLATPGVVSASAATLTLPDATAKVWVWLLQNGTLQAVATSTAPPSAQACLLGCVTTAAGAITAIDTSGVMYRQGGGLAWRKVADAVTPTDTPPAYLAGGFLTIGTTADYLWDGAQYVSFSGTASLPNHPVRKITASGNVVAGDEAIWIDASAGNVVLTLSAANGSVVKWLQVRRLDASSNTVTIAAASGENINGAATLALTTQYQSVSLRAGQAAVPGSWGID